MDEKAPNPKVICLIVTEVLIKDNDDLVIDLCIERKPCPDHSKEEF